MSQQQPTIQQGSAMALVLTIAGLLFVFGFIAQEVVKGKTLAFDWEVMLALRSSADPRIPMANVAAGSGAGLNKPGKHYCARHHNIGGRGLSVFGRQIGGGVADVDCCVRRNCS
jgi:hypothetical protein